jgi:hypothetical protein
MFKKSLTRLEQISVANLGRIMNFELDPGLLGHAGLFISIADQNLILQKVMLAN